MRAGNRVSAHSTRPVTLPVAAGAAGCCALRQQEKATRRKKLDRPGRIRRVLPRVAEYISHRQNPGAPCNPRPTGLEPEYRNPRHPHVILLSTSPSHPSSRSASVRRSPLAPALLAAALTV